MIEESRTMSEWSTLIDHVASLRQQMENIPESMRSARLIIAQQVERIALLEERLIEAGKPPAPKGKLSHQLRQYLAVNGESTLDQIAPALFRSRNGVQVALSVARDEIEKRREGKRVFYRLREA